MKLVGRPRKSYKILIGCGGGIFGYIMAYFLSKTSVAHIKAKDLIYAGGGTSIGGINMLNLGADKNFTQLHEAFIEMGDICFEKNWRSRFDPWYPSHPDSGLNESLQKALHGRRYGDMNFPIIVPTIDFQHNKPKVYDNIIHDDDVELLAWEIGRSTAAAPTYFVPWKAYIDGGLLANMPVMQTASALKSKKGIPFDRMDIFVMGTGHFPGISRNMRKVCRWSKLHWLSPMLKYLTKANEMNSDFIAKQIGFKSYRYWNPVLLEESWDMDEPELIPQLELRCEAYLEDFEKAFLYFLNQ